MTIQDLNFNFINVLNRVKVDKYGRVTAFLAINKPIGITSHDVVDHVRRVLKIRNVGHVGALDPFASGVILILAGKEYTSLSEQLMLLGKSYEADVLLGVSTDTLDIEGKITEKKEVENFDQSDFETTLKTFEGSYDQYVPVYSSVKVNGQKLRVLARQSEKFEIVETEGKRFAEFQQSNNKTIKVEIPQRSITISDIKLLDFLKVNASDLLFLSQNNIGGEHILAKIHFACTKGTYVRQLASDLGRNFGLPGMLAGLKRTSIGSISLSDTIEMKDVILPKI